MTGRMLQGLAMAVLAALLLTACGTIEKEKKSQALHDATRYYEYALRWSDYESANKLRNPASMAVSPDPASLEKFRVTSYKLVSSQMSADGMTLEQVIEIHYYNENTLREKKLVDRQKWIYAQDTEVWYLDGPLPSFK